MAGLLEKMNSLPQGNSVEIADILDGDNEQQEVSDDVHVQEAEKPAEQPKPEAKEEKEQAQEEDREPPKNASKSEKDAYKARRVKAADEEKARAKAESDQFKKERDEALKEKEDWKRQAETVAQRPTPVREAAPVARAEETPDFQKDPAGFLAKGLKDANERYERLENQITVSAATNELSALEGKYAEKSPDYHDVMRHAEDTEVKKMMMMNPKANEAAIRASFKADKVKVAVAFLAQGKDPVEGLYNLSKVSYGYQPKKVEEPAGTTKADKEAAEKARFAAVNKNKSKSATGLSVGGASGETEVRGPQTTGKRTLRDFANLTKAQKDADYISG